MIPVVPCRHVVDELQLGVPYGDVDREEAVPLRGGDPPVSHLAVLDRGEGIHPVGDRVACITGEKDGAVGEGHEIVARAVRAVGGGVLDEGDIEANEPLVALGDVAAQAEVGACLGGDHVPRLIQHRKALGKGGHAEGDDKGIFGGDRPLHRHHLQGGLAHHGVVGLHGKGHGGIPVRHADSAVFVEVHRHAVGCAREGEVGGHAQPRGAVGGTAGQVKALDVEGVIDLGVPLAVEAGEILKEMSVGLQRAEDGVVEALLQLVGVLDLPREAEELVAEAHPVDGHAGLHHEVDGGVGLLEAGSVPLLPRAGAEVEGGIRAARAEKGDLLLDDLIPEDLDRLQGLGVSRDTVVLAESLEAGHHLVGLGDALLGHAIPADLHGGLAVLDGLEDVLPLTAAAVYDIGAQLQGGGVARDLIHAEDRLQDGGGLNPAKSPTRIRDGGLGGESHLVIGVAHQLDTGLQGLGASRQLVVGQKPHEGVLALPEIRPVGAIGLGMVGAGGETAVLSLEGEHIRRGGVHDLAEGGVIRVGADEAGGPHELAPELTRGEHIHGVAEVIGQGVHIDDLEGALGDDADLLVGNARQVDGACGKIELLVKGVSEHGGVLLGLIGCSIAYFGGFVKGESGGNQKRYRPQRRAVSGFIRWHPPSL